MTSRSLALALLICFAPYADAADWPQWRGPDRSGVSLETGHLQVWPKDGPKLLWTFKNAGSGHSSCAIVGDKLYTLGTRGTDEVVLALDVNKGTELWFAKIGPIFTFKKNTWGDGPRGTPTIDGDRLYALGAQGNLVCLDLAQKGQEVWRKNLQKDFGGEMMTEWGYAESPLVDGDKLVCTPGGAKGTLLTLNKKDGTTIWQSAALKNKAPYSSIMPATIHGVRQYIQNSYVEATDGFVSGVAAEDGKLLWSMPVKNDSYDIGNTPIIADSLVYVTTDNPVSGCHCFTFDAKFKGKDLYSKKNQKVMKNNHGGVVLVGGHVFGHSIGAWVCQDIKTGAEAWAERETLNCHSGSLVAADGLLYLLTDGGTVGLIEASPKEFKVRSFFKLPEASTLRGTAPTALRTATQALIWSHPVIANGRLYVRDQELVFCFDVRRRNEAAGCGPRSHE
jgi:outer membrane protein assembly factor BamB